MTGEEQVPAAATVAESLDAAAIEQVGDAAKRLRDTATWTVGAVAALATTVGGAITFTGLRDLDGVRFAIGAVGLIAIVFAAVRVIMVVAKVLAPTHSTLTKAGERLTHGELAEDMLLGARNLTEFTGNLKTAEQELVTALAASPGVDGDIARARRLAALYGDRAERIRLLAHFSKLEKRWGNAQRKIKTSALIVAAGVVAFQFAASDQRMADGGLPETAKAPDLIVDFEPGVLGKAVEENCAKRRRAVAVPGQSTGQKGLLLRKTESCGPLFVRVAGTQVRTTPARIRQRG